MKIFRLFVGKEECAIISLLMNIFFLFMEKFIVVIFFIDEYFR